MWAAAGMLLLAAGLVAVLYATRMRAVASRVGSFECALRVAGGQKWSNGWASYGVDRIDWFAIASLRRRPRYTWRRSRVDVVAAVHRRSDVTDRLVVDVTIDVVGQRFDLVMVTDAFFALRSWLEAAPPAPSSFE